MKWGYAVIAFLVGMGLAGLMLWKRGYLHGMA